MNAQGLAWAWLNAFSARPFALLESPNDKKRLTLIAGEPLFVFEGRGAEASVQVAGRRYASRKRPEAAFAALGVALARRHGGSAWWPLIHALGYEAGRRFEKLPATRPEPVGLPDWWAFLPGAWLRWDGRWRAEAQDLRPGLARELAGALGIPASALKQASLAPERRAVLKRLLALKPQAGDPDFKGAPRRQVRSNLGARAFQARVHQAQAHIRAGDIYQANLSHRFSAPIRARAFQVYRRLMAVNPAPMAAFVDLGGVQLLSASPERFLKLQGRRIETWPIAGTAPRLGKAGEAKALRRSKKDAAEHVMLVDLERNDLGRVCAGGSVKVPRFKAVQSFRHVHHLVSRVTGTLKPGLSLPQVYEAAFPGGSITGAPKIRCMHIISALERESRGWYTGSLGWWDPKAGQADSSILIRSIFIKGGMAYWQVGAGIVADSKPASEWAETLAKSKGLERALFRTRGAVA